MASEQQPPSATKIDDSNGVMHFPIGKSRLEREALLKYRLEECEPVYTHKRFREWAEYIFYINGKGFTQEVQTFDAQGNNKKILVRAGGPPKQVMLPSYHQWAVLDFIQPCSSPGFQNMLFRLFDAPERQQPEQCCKYVKEENLKQLWVGWQQSPFCKQVIEHITKNAYNMAVVENFVCFGLGPIEESDDPEDHIQRTFLQHAMAVEIRDALVRTQRKEDLLFQIPIAVQDPRYCKNCVRLLLDVLKVGVMNTPTGFPTVDKTTFVISKAPSVCVRQIVADLTADAGGPAGMLCDPIEDNGLDEMAHNQHSDPSSPRLWDFKERNKELELMLDDTEDKIKYMTDDVPPVEVDGLPNRVFDDVGLYLRKRA
ncbi:hypothetical protein N0V83_001761 [Neocucurbitaria cava]|uniref:SRR1-like domain-containing protein n=1 Tax=Neocucurbitaria cava TaxID=798079 RepID=A0A9W9CQQ5_9PLEO|nr:hypothetical protein N0V83_001761 [Neocucurbitaria cava]